MAVRHLTYLDLTPDQRREGAARAREKYRSVLANPFLTKEQSEAVQKEIAKIDSWERGTAHTETDMRTAKQLPAPVKNALKALPPAPSERKPVHHDVRVADTTKVTDKIADGEVEIDFADDADDEDLT